MLGFGWCHLRSNRAILANATLGNIGQIESEIDEADKRLWENFRVWMLGNVDPFTQWTLSENLNNHHGLLTYCLSRNHRSSSVWEMLQWIAKNGSGSYGLFYCHDDEDTMDRNSFNRQPPMDYDNVFRVYRLLNGNITELDDPFFGLIDGGINPIHPYDRAEH